MAQMSALVDKIFKVTIIITFESPRKTMLKHVKKKDKIALSHQIQNITREIENIKNQIKILELKSTIFEIQNLPKGLTSGYELAEENISKLGDKSVEIMCSINRKNKHINRTSEIFGTLLSTTIYMQREYQKKENTREIKQQINISSNYLTIL